ncbi:MAG: hypothetical protein AB7U73_03680, partial [Pirellulales bacterium]
GGTEPVGPGRAVTALLGVAAGLVIGLGVLILTVPALPTTGTDLAVATETTVTRGRPVAQGHVVRGGNGLITEAIAHAVAKDKSGFGSSEDVESNHSMLVRIGTEASTPVEVG